MQIHGKSELAEALDSLSKIPKQHEGRVAWESAALDRWHLRTHL
jgi:hypothetical protein